MRYIVIFLFLCLGCQNQRKFEWSKELEQMTNKNITAWIEKSPFNGNWNTNKTSDKITIDNRAQVFPFMGKFKNEANNFRNFSGIDSDIYQKETIIFKDSNFGESFVYASLIYKMEELFLDDFYSENGNPFFSGQNAINQNYSAKLSETMLYNKNDKYKAVVYWVNSNNKTYLFGFSQKEKLLLQFGFPSDLKNKQKGLKKIKEINLALNLNIKEWSQATEEKLEINNNPKSFWKDHYTGIYYNKHTIPEVRIKIRNTNFKELKSKYINQKGVDYIFAYEKEDKKHMISFKRFKTTLNREQYENGFKKSKCVLNKHYGNEKMFITKEKIINGYVIIDTETYFKDHSYLKIQISYPENNIKAKDELLDILTNIKINKY